MAVDDEDGYRAEGLAVVAGDYTLRVGVSDSMSPQRATVAAQTVMMNRR